MPAAAEEELSEQARQGHASREPSARPSLASLSRLEDCCGSPPDWPCPHVLRTVTFQRSVLPPVASGTPACVVPNGVDEELVARVKAEIWGDTGRYGEMRGDVVARVKAERRHLRRRVHWVEKVLNKANIGKN